MPNQPTPQSQSGNQNTGRPQNDRKENFGKQAKPGNETERTQNDKNAPSNKSGQGYGSKH